jgi:hypothetical protein
VGEFVEESVSDFKAPPPSPILVGISEPQLFRLVVPIVVTLEVFGDGRRLISGSPRSTVPLYLLPLLQTKIGILLPPRPEL